MRADAEPVSAMIRLASDEYSRAGEVLGRAFFETPQWTGLMPDPDARRTKLPAMFTGAARWTTAAHGIAERTAGFEAVALWLPPGRDIGPGSILRSGLSAFRWALTPPYVGLRRMMTVLGRFDTKRREVMPEAHWYLMALGVDPARQGSGHGSQAVRAGIRRADRDDKPIYLETETGLNLGFYERLGFELIGELTIPEIDLGFSLLVHRPATADGGTDR